jgi:hypothetical protein
MICISRNRGAWFTRLAGVLLLLPAIVFAQGTVTIYGTVTDPSGAAIAGATVSVTNQATGQSRDTVTAIDGNYVVPDLRVGAYRLTVTASASRCRSGSHPGASGRKPACRCR